MRIDVIVPTKDNAATVGQVVRVARCAPSVREVVVVDRGSTDGTLDEVGGGPGTRVVRLEPGHGRDQAIAVGVEASGDADILVLLDADLEGLTQAHVEMLLWAVRYGGCGMACGLVDRGPFLNPIFERVLPIVDGQRALRRDVWEALTADDLRSGALGAALNSVCAGLLVPTHTVVLAGLHTRVPAAPLPALGMLHEPVGFANALLSYASYMVSHRRPALSRSAAAGTAATRAA